MKMYSAHESDEKEEEEYAWSSIRYLSDSQRDFSQVLYKWFYVCLCFVYIHVLSHVLHIVAPPSNGKASNDDARHEQS